MKTASIKARVTPDTLERLDRIVEATVGDRSDHIRRAIDDYIAAHEPAATSLAPTNVFVDAS